MKFTKLLPGIVLTGSLAACAKYHDDARGAQFRAGLAQRCHRHCGMNPQLTGTPAQFVEALCTSTPVKVLAIQPGEAFSF